MTPGWSVRGPGGPVDDVRAFRARVLHDGGRRPGFRTADGRYDDPDPIDEHAHHVVVTVDGAIAGVLRVVPLDTTDRGFCDRLLGPARVEEILARAGTHRAAVWEGSGWAADPGRRSGLLGARVLAAGTAVAEALGRTHLLGAAGVRGGQYLRVRQLGYRAAEGVGPVPLPRMADEVRIVCGPSATTAPGFRALVARAAAELREARFLPSRHPGRPGASPAA